MRLFIAVTFDNPSLEKLLAFQSQIKSAVGNNIRIMPRNSLHITLLFSGNGGTNEAEVLKNLMTKTWKKFGKKKFSLFADSIELGPEPRRPRLIWMRCESHETEELKEILNENILLCETKNSILYKTISEEKRKFIPHITLVRFKHQWKPNASLHLPLCNNEELIPESLMLFESILHLPQYGGTEYKKLFEIKIGD